MDDAKEQEPMVKETPVAEGDELEPDIKDEVEMKEDEGSKAAELPSTEKRIRHAISGRGVTLKMLMMDGVIHAGESLISLDYLVKPCKWIQSFLDLKGVIQPEESLISLDHLGQKFTADLLQSGKIKSNEFDQTFPSPSSWAMYCKKLVNPAKPSGCGWSTVKYKGRKLDSWKAIWLRQLNPQSSDIHETQSTSTLPTESMSETDQSSSIQTPTVDSLSVGHLGGPFIPNKPVFEEDNCVLDLTKKPGSQEAKVDNVLEVTERKSEADMVYMGEQEEALNLSMKDTSSTKKVQKTPPLSIKQEIKTESLEPLRSPSGAMKHATLPCRSAHMSNYFRYQCVKWCLQLHPNWEVPSGAMKHATLPCISAHIDQNQLVECETFSNLGKAQPYTVSMSTNTLLLLDFHSHLTTSEVVGYLGGKWDQSAQHLSIQQTFPCRCRLGDSHAAIDIEEEIRASMKHLGMSLVGWYHSHPYSPAEPSVKDIECQMMYQLKMKGVKSTYYPCVGIINSPYDGKSLKTESSIRMYMVMPPPETVQTDYGVPMALKYSTKQNQAINEEILHEMRLLCEFYNTAPDWISFKHSWHPSITYLEKLKTSLHDKLPSDQTDKNGAFLDFVQHVLSLNS